MLEEGETGDVIGFEGNMRLCVLFFKLFWWAFGWNSTVRVFKSASGGLQNLCTYTKVRERILPRLWNIWGRRTHLGTGES